MTSIINQVVGYLVSHGYNVIEAEYSVKHDRSRKPWHRIEILLNGTHAFPLDGHAPEMKHIADPDTGTALPGPLRIDSVHSWRSIESEHPFVRAVYIGIGSVQTHAAIIGGNR